MKIAVTRGTLRIPPTYFAVQHTRLLQRTHEMRTFALVADVRDSAVAEELDIVDMVRWRKASFRSREVIMPLAIRRMSRELRRFDPAVVHQHFATWSTSAVDAAKKLDVPLLVTVHGSDVFKALRSTSALNLTGRPMLAWHHRNIRRAYSQATRILAVSRYLADMTVRAGAPANKVEVHYQGIDTEYFTPKAVTENSEPVVLFVGALSNAKGLPDLLEASQRLVRTHPHRLRLIGGGPLQQAAEQAAHEHRHIELLGSLPRDAVREQLRAADVLVLPSMPNNGAREAAGLVLLEAQACGVPVVAYDSGGTSEMLEAGKTGFLVPEGKVSRLGDALEQVLSFDAATKAEFSAAAREFVVSQRSLASSADALERHYLDLTR